MDKPKAETPSRPHIRFDRKNAAIGVLVLAILVSVGMWLVFRKDNQPVQSDQNNPSQVITNALSKQNGASKEELEAALRNNPTKEQRIQLLQILSGEAQKRGDFHAAVDYMQQTYDAGLKDALLTQNIGILYLEKLNDKARALKYLKMSLDDARATVTEKPYLEKVIATNEKKIKELEGQGVEAAR